MADTEPQATVTETVTTTETPAPEAETPEADTPEPEAETDAASATPPVVVVPMPSLAPSAPADTTSETSAQMERQNKLLKDNLELVFRRLDQLDQMLTGTLAPFQAALDELDTTMEAMKLVISRQDEQQEQLALALVALAKVTSELTLSAATLTRAPTSQNR